MRKLFGFLVAVACYIPIVLLAIWLGEDKEILGLIAAGLFLFFGFALCMAIYSAVGIPDKEKTAGSVEPIVSEQDKIKEKDKLDTGSAAIAVTMANTDQFDDFDDGE